MMKSFWLASGCIALAASASAYEIHTRTGIKNLDGIHEAMSSSAQACLAQSPAGAQPSDCWSEFAKIKDYPRPVPGTLAYSARWPDDPTRQGSGATYPKIGLTLFTECKKVMSRSQAVDRAGLLCSSHYGRLQFMHAMKSAGDKDAAQARQRMLAWAQFAYEVAQGSVAPSDSLCNAMKGRDGIEDAFTFADPGKCKPRKKFFLLRIFSKKKEWPAYTVGSLFTQTCSNPFKSNICWEKTAEGGRDEMTRSAAKGAILHLIQDSFSQAHAARAVGQPPSETGPFDPKVVCRPATDFFNYHQQDPEVHGVADHPPMLVGCGQGNTIDDAVTASAKFLWHLQEGKSASEFVAYFDKHVLGLTG